MRIFVPGDAAAVAVGADAVAQAIWDAARQRGVAVDIVRNGSRGMFWLEPMVEVETQAGRIAYGPVDRADIPGLFEAGFLEGGAHSLRIGRPEEHPFLKRQTRLAFARCGITDPLSLDDYRAHGGLMGLERAIAKGPAATVEEVIASGLRGRGGAGFPTGIKWRTVAETKAQQKYIVCNADEGDSGTFSDRMMMEGDPFCLIEGMAIAGMATGATKGYIYIRSEYPHAIAAMQEAVNRSRLHGLLGAQVLGSPFAFDMTVRVGAGAAAGPCWAVRQADRYKQRYLAGVGTLYPRRGRRRLPRFRHGPVARHDAHSARR
jgi:formate dehydrogenase iron-sulfur subunit